jgi:hypothetical protein
MASDRASDPADAPDVEEGAVPAVRSSPFCVHLWSKKAFFLKAPPMAERDLLDGSGHCWCRRTMQAVGPDGEVVDPAECRAGRACFQSIL